MTLFASIPMLAAAVASPLRSASDYVLEIPMTTNLISGKVMGENGGYHAVRYEDYCFIREGLRERLVLADADNGRPRYRSETPTINRLTDGGTDYDDPAKILRLYMSATNVMSTSARMIETNTSKSVYVGMPVTNTIYQFDQIGINYKIGSFEIAYYDPFTNETFVAQTMTNGTENVFTNRYSFYSNVVTKVKQTNHFVDDEDFCTADFIHPIDVHHVHMSTADKHLYNRKYNISAITNLYELLKSAWRTKPLFFSVIPTAPEIEQYHAYFYRKSDAFVTGPETHTNTYTNYPFASFKYIVHNAEGISDDLVAISYYESTIKAGPSGFFLKTNIPPWFIDRFDNVNVYVKVHFKLHRRTQSERHITNEGRAMVPIGQADVVDNGGALSFLITFSDVKDIMTRACATAGLHLPAYGDTEGNIELDFNGESEAFYVQLDVKPRTSLPGWSHND